MSRKNGDTTYLLRFIAMLLVFAVMIPAGAIGCNEGCEGCGCCCEQPSIDVDKTVWDQANGTWAKGITVDVGDTIRFNCTIYNSRTNCVDCCNLTNITVWDVLPEGLEYDNNETYTNANPPDIVSDGGTVMWKFTDLTLEPCEGMTIEFNASVVRCVSGANYVNATAWYNQSGCCGCCGGGCKEVLVFDEDTTTTIRCPTTPPDCDCEQPSIEVDKTVWDPISGTWAKRITVDVGDTVRFNCTIYNSRMISNCVDCCNLTNITVWDVLPEGLEYDNNETYTTANPPDIYVSLDNGTVMWKFTDLTLEPCEGMTIEFNASVVKCASDSNYVNVTAWYNPGGCEEVLVFDEDTTTKILCPTPPDTPPDTPPVPVPTQTPIGIALLIGCIGLFGAGRIMRGR